MWRLLSRGLRDRAARRLVRGHLGLRAGAGLDAGGGEVRGEPLSAHVGDVPALHVAHHARRGGAQHPVQRPRRHAAHGVALERRHHHLVRERGMRLDGARLDGQHLVVAVHVVPGQVPGHHGEGDRPRRWHVPPAVVLAREGEGPAAVHDQVHQVAEVDVDRGDDGVAAVPVPAEGEPDARVVWVPLLAQVRQVEHHIHALHEGEVHGPHAAQVDVARGAAAVRLHGPAVDAHPVELEALLPPARVVGPGELGAHVHERGVVDAQRLAVRLGAVDGDAI
mmetsp:Transcript_30337/g.80361  ORF Transcript_30337/g.80361 Transcript_30337/m.80361 type:complete len:279 (+) Transcript_30337:191-1027(+)